MRTVGSRPESLSGFTPRSLEDGSLPHGVKYPSKHGADWSCWATWLREVDDGKDIAAEPTKADYGPEMKDCAHNSDLRDVTRLFGLRCL